MTIIIYPPKNESWFFRMDHLTFVLELSELEKLVPKENDYWQKRESRLPDLWYQPVVFLSSKSLLLNFLNLICIRSKEGFFHIYEELMYYKLLASFMNLYC